MDDIQKQIALLKTGMDKSFKKPVSKEITQPLKNIDEGITNLKDKETSEEGLTVNFAGLSESLEKIAEGITDLNNNISELLKVEKKEGKETRADQVERMQDAFETEKGAAEGGGGPIGALVDIMRESFNEQIKLLEMIEKNTAEASTGAGTLPVGLPTSVGLDGPGGKDTKGGKKGLLSRIGGGVKTVGKAALRFAGPLAAAGIAGMSGYEGAGRAGEFFGKNQEDATATEKTAGAIGQIASDFTLGMVDPKEFAIKTKEFLDVIKNFFLETLPRIFTEDIPNFFTEKLEEFKTAFPEVFKVISEDIPAFFTQTIPEKLSEAKDLLVEKITAIKDVIVGTFVSIGTGIKEGIQGAIDFIMGIVEKVKNLPGAAVDKAKELADKGKEAVKGGIKKVGSFFGFGDDEEEGVGKKIQKALPDEIAVGKDTPTGMRSSDGKISTEDLSAKLKKMEQDRLKQADELQKAIDDPEYGGEKVQEKISKRGIAGSINKVKILRSGAQALNEAEQQLQEAQAGSDQRHDVKTITVNSSTTGAQTTSVVTLKPHSRNSPNPLTSSVAMAQARNMDFGVY